MDYFQFHSDADNEEVGNGLEDYYTEIMQSSKLSLLLNQVGSMLKQIDTKDDLEVLTIFL